MRKQALAVRFCWLPDLVRFLHRVHAHSHQLHTLIQARLYMHARRHAGGLLSYDCLQIIVPVTPALARELHLHHRQP